MNTRKFVLVKFVTLLQCGKPLLVALYKFLRVCRLVCFQNPMFVTKTRWKECKVTFFSFVVFNKFVLRKQLCVNRYYGHSETEVPSIRS